MLLVELNQGHVISLYQSDAADCLLTLGTIDVIPVLSPLVLKHSLDLKTRIFFSFLAVPSQLHFGPQRRLFPGSIVGILQSVVSFISAPASRTAIFSLFTHAMMEVIGKIPRLLGFFFCLVQVLLSIYLRFGCNGGDDLRKSMNIFLLFLNYMNLILLGCFALY